MSERGKRPAYQWYPGDWRRDTALQSCTFGARALWREMLDLMHDGEPYGHLTAGGVPIGPQDLARMVGVRANRVVAWLAELEERHVFSRTDRGVIYSRRMVRDEHVRTVRAEAGSLGGKAAHLLKQTGEQNPNTPPATAEQKGPPAVAVAVAVAKNLDAERRDRDTSHPPPPDDPDPLGRETPAAGPPAAALPPEAEQFVHELYGLATEKRRADVRQQLYDALDTTGRGARIRRGVYVRARSPEHLAQVCTGVRLEPPRELDAAIVWVLKRLQDLPPGPTVTERAAQDEAAARELEDAYHGAMRAAGLAWCREHEDEFERVRRPIDAQFGTAPSGFAKIARDAALAQACARAAGFPTFDEWQLQLTRGAA